jgi:hypothetical protein
MRLSRRSSSSVRPLIFGLLELGHPALLPGDDIVATIAPIATAPIATWWTALHVLQVPLFALLGVAVFLLIRGLDSRAATVSRYAIAIFIVVYPAFDAAVGIASGVLCRTSSGADLEAALQNLFWGPVTGSMASWLSLMAGGAARSGLGLARSGRIRSGGGSSRASGGIVGCGAYSSTWAIGLLVLPHRRDDA